MSRANRSNFYKKNTRVLQTQRYRQTRRMNDMLARRAAQQAVAMRTEKKGVDTVVLIGAVDASTSTNDDIIPVNLIQTGTGSFNRIGRKIKMLSVRIMGTFRATSSYETTTANLLGNTVRMVVVYDKQPSGALPTFNQIFGHTTQTGSEASNYMDPIRYDNMERFRILKDCRYDLNSQAPPTSGGTQNLTVVNRNFDEYVKLNNLETVYQSTSDPSTITDISSGALYVIFRADVSTAVTFVNINAGKIRLRYTDS